MTSTDRVERVARERCIAAGHNPNEPWATTSMTGYRWQAFVAPSSPDGLGDELAESIHWLSEVARHDLSEIVADGGVTAAMVVQQEAKGVIVPRLNRVLTALRTSQAVERGKVVAWLRHNPHGLSKDPIRHSLADAIERGDHERTDPSPDHTDPSRDAVCIHEAWTEGSGVASIVASPPRPSLPSTASLTGQATNGWPTSQEASDMDTDKAVEGGALPAEGWCAAEFIEWTANVAQQVGWQAGVGGMETAGAIVSYLAKHPEKLADYMREGFFALPIEIHEQGCLSWHAMDQRVVSPEFARRARQVKAMEKGQ